MYSRQGKHTILIRNVSVLFGTQFPVHYRSRRDYPKLASMKKTESNLCIKFYNTPGNLHLVTIINFLFGSFRI